MFLFMIKYIVQIFGMQNSCYPLRSKRIIMSHYTDGFAVYIIYLPSANKLYCGGKLMILVKRMEMGRKER
jgi:hypothetical protein